MIPETDMGPRILVVIPVYNHGQFVERVIEECLNIHPHVLVVDDGSTDLPPDFHARAGVPVLRHPVNQGKGAALMTGAGYAREQGFTHMVTLDADLQHHPGDIPLFIRAIDDHPHALIVGQREFSGTAAPGSARYGRAFSNFWYRVQTGQRIGDAQSGFRAYPLQLLEELKLKHSRYDFEIEVLVKAAWGGAEVLDLPISVYYPPPEKRITHFKRFMDNLRLTHLNTGLTLRSFMPWPHTRVSTAPARVVFSVFRPLDSIRLFLNRELSPWEIAMSGAVGIFLGTLPLIALHTLAILMVTGFCRLNKVVAVGVSTLATPPFVPALCIEVGHALTHNGEWLTDISMETLGHQYLDRILEWCLGSLLVAPALALVVFGLLYAGAKTLAGRPDTILPKEAP